MLLEVPQRQTESYWEHNWTPVSLVFGWIGNVSHLYLFSSEESELTIEVDNLI